MDKKTNASAVRDYHKKLTTLATVRVPSVEVIGVDIRSRVQYYLAERYGVKDNGALVKSMNEYILDLIQKDMGDWYEDKDDVRIARSVREPLK